MDDSDHFLEARDEVLKTIGFSSWEEYLRSPLWARIERKTWSTNKKRCSICKAAASIVFHRRYDRYTLRGIRRQYLWLLCSLCHSHVVYGKTHKEQDAIAKQMYIEQAAIRKTQFGVGVPGGKAKVKKLTKQLVRLTNKSRALYLFQLGFDSYDSYLRSSLWRRIRSKALRDANHECRCCGGRATQVHHSLYDKDTLAGRTMAHLHAICRTCHNWIEWSEGRKIKGGHVHRKFTELIGRNAAKGIVLPFEPATVDLKVKKKYKHWKEQRPKVITPPPGPITYDELNRFMAWLATQPKPTGPPVFNQPPWQFEGEEPEKPKYRPLVEIRGVPAEPEPPKRVKKTPPPPHPDGNWRTRQAAKAAAWRLKHGIPEPDWGSEADTPVRSYWVCFTPDPPDAMQEPVAQTSDSPPSSRLLRMKQAAAGRTGSPVIFN